MMDLKVVFNNPDNSTELSIGTIGEISVGSERLSQEIILTILTDIGTKTGLANFGGSIKNLTKMKEPSSSSTTRSEIHARIMEVERYIKQSQVGMYLPDDERLVSLDATKVSYNVELAKWEIEMLMVTVDGAINPITIG